MAIHAVYGDTSGRLAGKQQGSAQSITGADNQDNSVTGDAYELAGAARGGNDTVRGGNNSSVSKITNTLLGDAVPCQAQS